MGAPPLQGCSCICVFINRQSNGFRISPPIQLPYPILSIWNVWMSSVNYERNARDFSWRFWQNQRLLVAPVQKLYMGLIFGLGQHAQARDYRQVLIWQRLLVYELVGSFTVIWVSVIDVLMYGIQSNPLRLEAASFKTRMQYLFRQCLCSLRFYPQIWNAYAMFMNEKSGHGISHTLSPLKLPINTLCRWRCSRFWSSFRGNAFNSSDAFLVCRFSRA